MLRLQPSDLVESRPQLGGLVHVDLARLLAVRLSKLLSDPQALDSRDENSSFAREVGRAVEAEVGRQDQLVLVEEVSVRVVAEIDGSALPLDLERIGSIGERRRRRSVVGERVEVLVLSRRAHVLAPPGLGRDALVDGTAVNRRRRPRRPRGAGDVGDGLLWTDYVAPRRLGGCRRRRGDGRERSTLDAAQHADPLILAEIFPFPVEPLTRILAAELRHLRLELECEDVVVAARGRRFAELRGRKRQRRHVLVDDAVSHLVVLIAEQRRLRGRDARQVLLGV